MAKGEKLSEVAWFQKGLRFECQRCGECCRGRPGFVWVSNPEAIGIAGYIQMTPDSFGAAYLRAAGDRTSLREKPNGDCVFWEKSIGCRIYPLRPTQCRTFPFWRQHLAAPPAWTDVARTCPGIGKGKLFRLHEILKRRERTW